MPATTMIHLFTAFDNEAQTRWGVNRILYQSLESVLAPIF